MAQPLTAPMPAAVTVDIPQPLKTQAPKPQVCVPRHVAIVPDERQPDAEAWVTALADLIEVCLAEGVADLSVLVWNGRNAAAAHLENLESWLRANVARLTSRGVKVTVLGRDHSSLNTLGDVLKSSAQTSNRPMLRLNLAVNYNGREELAAAVQKLAQEASSSGTASSQISIDQLNRHLLSHSLPSVDLLVRTGGDTQLSDFLLWQAAYAELLFMEKSWTKMRGEDFLQALSDYARRRRTFGGLSA